MREERVPPAFRRLYGNVVGWAYVTNGRRTLSRFAHPKAADPKKLRPGLRGLSWLDGQGLASSRRRATGVFSTTSLSASVGHSGAPVAPPVTGARRRPQPSLHGSVTH